MINPDKACAEIIPVPVLSDNYAYLIIDRDTKQTACIDPAEPKKVIEAAKKANVEISLGICTHKHVDHSGGNAELHKLLNVDIIGSAHEETPGVTKKIKNEETFELGSLIIRAFHTPCHTAGHLLYFVTHKNNHNCDPVLFTGDTLFIGGCGRFFEGNAQQMLNAMNLIKSLPDNTQIYCGHEYTVSNLKFALSVENSNEDLKAVYNDACKKRDSNQYTIPSSVQQEKKINPFMRVSEKKIKENLNGGDKMDDVEVMNQLRQMKNNF